MGSYLGEAAAEPRSGACRFFQGPVMRNTLYLSIILALSPCSVPLAFAAGADGGLEARVSTPIAAQPLARALEQLSRGSGVQFRTRPAVMPHGRAVPRGATVRQALTLLAGAGPGYTVVDGNVIAIDPAPARNQQAGRAEAARGRGNGGRPWTRSEGDCCT